MAGRVADLDDMVDMFARLVRLEARLGGRP